MSEWEKRELVDLADIVMGQSPDRLNINTDETGLPFLQGCAEFGPRYPSANVYCSPPLRQAPAGSFLISVRAPVGTMNEANQTYCIGRGLAAITGKESTADTSFLRYAIQQNTGFLHRRSQGSTFLAISKGDLEKCPVPDLDLDVQEKIATILETVDEAIERTEALIGKYEQIKAGMMQDLFARGLTPGGKLRPPRGEAPHLYKQTPIGWIPKEWEVKPLSCEADIMSGVTLNASTVPKSGAVVVPYLRVANVQDGYLNLAEIKNVKVSPEAANRYRLQTGDVLMNEGGDFDKLGRGTVWRGEVENCIHQNHVFRVRPNKGGLRSDFLSYWSQSLFGKKYFLISSKQSTNLASINSTQLKAFPIGIPDTKEQEEIEKRIDSVQLKLSVLNEECQKLRHQKSGLMHDLLTGKVPVKV